jgi:alcohol dehydrogenase (NADP+)
MTPSSAMALHAVPTTTLNNGQSMPLLGLGTWKSEPGLVKAAVKAAIAMGYRHIDCAHIYGNEKEIGEAFLEVFAEGICERRDLFVTSKLWNDSHGLAEVMPALHETLANLQLDYLDMYLSKCGCTV